jgi:hypothetical protein
VLQEGALQSSAGLHTLCRREHRSKFVSECLFVIDPWGKLRSKSRAATMQTFARMEGVCRIQIRFVFFDLLRVC